MVERRNGCAAGVLGFDHSSRSRIPRKSWRATELLLGDIRAIPA
jgi:hypothetical protein